MKGAPSPARWPEPRSAIEGVGATAGRKATRGSQLVLDARFRSVQSARVDRENIPLTDRSRRGSNRDDDNGLERPEIRHVTRMHPFAPNETERLECANSVSRARLERWCCVDSMDVVHATGSGAPGGAYDAGRGSGDRTSAATAPGSRRRKGRRGRLSGRTFSDFAKRTRMVRLFELFRFLGASTRQTTICVSSSPTALRSEVRRSVDLTSSRPQACRRCQ